MGRKWNIFRGTIEQIIGFIMKLLFIAVIALVVYFVWVNFIKQAQTQIDKGSAGMQLRADKQLAEKK